MFISFSKELVRTAISRKPSQPAEGVPVVNGQSTKPNRYSSMCAWNNKWMPQNAQEVVKLSIFLHDSFLSVIFISCSGPFSFHAGRDTGIACFTSVRLHTLML